ncbi:hypothetical protein B0H13DRAFT_2366296 [Mycena leptocephala]|nr:hypothetical protein B0H13DRAFT_2366296 [Mycena leptocephala]
MSDGSSDSGASSDSTSSFVKSPCPMRQLTLCQIWNKKGAAPDALPYLLRPRPSTPPSPPATPPVLEIVSIALSPFPDTFTRAHLCALDFRLIQWHDQLGPFVDLYGRIGAMYIGAPLESLEWERAIIQGGEDMLDARDCLQVHRQATVDAISAGIQCSGPAGNRPQDIRSFPVSLENVVLTQLRSSSAIQTIASFQNAMLHKIEPHAWLAANKRVEAVLAHDSGLHLPYDIPNDGPRQPSAFSRVEYHFTTGGSPRRKPSRMPGAPRWSSLRRRARSPLAVKTNLGSSERPYLVDENGHIVAGLILIPDLGAKNRHRATSFKSMVELLPSCPGRLPAALPDRRLAQLPGCSRRRQRPPIWSGLPCERLRLVPIPSRAATRVKPRDPLRRGMGGQAFRVHRVPALNDNDLYLTQMRPPPRAALFRTINAILPRYEIAPCIVSLRPWHCFVCIRRWLESSWECPTCRAVMTEPPMPNYDYEASIAHDHPEWRDTSTVNYSWKGLWFPAKPFVPPSPY